MPMMSKSATTTERLTPVHPGVVLKEEFMEPLGLSANALGAKICVPPNRISEIIRGRRSITADTALRLADHLGTTAEFWMNLQVHHDLEVARDRRAEVA